MVTRSAQRDSVRRCASSIALLAGACMGVHQVQAQTYTVVVVPEAAPDSHPTPTGLGDAGLLVGINTRPNHGGDFRGFVHVPGGGVTLVPKLIDNGPFHVGVVRAITPNGTMFGGSSDATAVNSAFRTTVANPTLLVRLARIPGSSATDVWAANAFDHSVGWIDTRFDSCTGPFCVINPGIPCRWDASGNIALLPLLPGSFGGLATGINSAGEIVGICGYLPEPGPEVRNTRAFHLAPGSSVPTALANPFVLNGPSRTYVIKNSGVIYGMADDASGIERPVRWQSPIQAVPVGTIAGFPHAVALDGLSSGLLAVGTCHTGPLNLQGVICGFVPLGGKGVLFAQGRGIDLDTLIPPGVAWRIRTATAMNEQGEIACAADLGSEHRVLILRPCGPLLVQQPQSPTACPSGTVHLAATSVSPATGVAEPTSDVWLWRDQGTTAWQEVVAGVNGGQNAFHATFTAAGMQLSPVAPVLSGSTLLRREFVLHTTNGCGTVQSDVATWTVCVADIDCSGALEVNDVFTFLNAWFAAAPNADFNGGGISLQDIFDFLNAWFAGCA